MDITCLPIDIQRNILRFLSHPPPTSSSVRRNISTCSTYTTAISYPSRSSLIFSIASTSPNGNSFT